jgi:hypothetical protein
MENLGFYFYSILIYVMAKKATAIFDNLVHMLQYDATSKGLHFPIKLSGGASKAIREIQLAKYSSK